MQSIVGKLILLAVGAAAASDANQAVGGSSPYPGKPISNGQATAGSVNAVDWSYYTFDTKVLAGARVTVSLTVTEGEAWLYTRQASSNSTFPNTFVYGGTTRGENGGSIEVVGSDTRPFVNIGVYGPRSNDHAEFEVEAVLDDSTTVVALIQNVPFFGRTTTSGNGPAYDYKYYSFSVGAHDVPFIGVTAFSDDPDLYVKKGTTLPSRTDFDYSANSQGGDSLYLPTCTEASCDYRIAVTNGWPWANTTYSIVAGLASAVTAIADGEPVSEPIRADSYSYFSFAVPASFAASDSINIVLSTAQGQYISLLADVTTNNKEHPSLQNSPDYVQTQASLNEFAVSGSDDAFKAHCPTPSKTQCYIQIAVYSYIAGEFTLTATKGGDAQVLVNGEPTEGDVDYMQARFYVFNLADAGNTVRFELSAVSGDPDILVSTVNPRPNPGNYTWGSFGSDGDDVVEIKSSDPNYRQTGNYYVAVQGASTNGNTYVLTATSVPPHGMDNSTTLLPDGVTLRAAIPPHQVRHFVYRVPDPLPAKGTVVELSVNLIESFHAMVLGSTLPANDPVLPQVVCREHWPMPLVDDSSAPAMDDWETCSRMEAVEGTFNIVANRTGLEYVMSIPVSSLQPGQSIVMGVFQSLPYEVAVDVAGVLSTDSLLLLSGQAHGGTARGLGAAQYFRYLIRSESTSTWNPDTVVMTQANDAGNYRIFASTAVPRPSRQTANFTSTHRLGMDMLEIPFDSLGSACQFKARVGFGCTLYLAVVQQSIFGSSFDITADVSGNSDFPVSLGIGSEYYEYIRQNQKLYFTARVDPIAGGGQQPVRIALRRMEGTGELGLYVLAGSPGFAPAVRANITAVTTDGFVELTIPPTDPFWCTECFYHLTVFGASSDVEFGIKVDVEDAHEFVTLENGVPLDGAVQRGDNVYYMFTLDGDGHEHDVITINVDMQDGDADIYVNPAPLNPEGAGYHRYLPGPGAGNSTWRDLSWGSARITIQPDDPNFCTNCVYLINTFGFMDARYTITVTAATPDKPELLPTLLAGEPTTISVRRGAYSYLSFPWCVGPPCKAALRLDWVPTLGTEPQLFVTNQYVNGQSDASKLPVAGSNDAHQWSFTDPTVREATLSPTDPQWDTNAQELTIGIRGDSSSWFGSRVTVTADLAADSESLTFGAPAGPFTLPAGAAQKFHLAVDADAARDGVAIHVTPITGSAGVGATVSMLGNSIYPICSGTKGCTANTMWSSLSGSGFVVIQGNNPCAAAAGVVVNDTCMAARDWPDFGGPLHLSVYSIGGDQLAFTVSAERLGADGATSALDVGMPERAMTSTFVACNKRDAAGECISDPASRITTSAAFFTVEIPVEGTSDDGAAFDSLSDASWTNSNGGSGAVVAKDGRPVRRLAKNSLAEAVFSVSRVCASGPEAGSVGVCGPPLRASVRSCMAHKCTSMDRFPYYNYEDESFEVTGGSQYLLVQPSACNPPDGSGGVCVVTLGVYSECAGTNFANPVENCTVASHLQVEATEPSLPAPTIAGADCIAGDATCRLPPAILFMNPPSKYYELEFAASTVGQPVTIQTDVCAGTFDAYACVPGITGGSKCGKGSASPANPGPANYDLHAAVDTRSNTATIEWEEKAGEDAVYYSLIEKTASPASAYAQAQVRVMVGRAPKLTLTTDSFITVGSIDTNGNLAVSWGAPDLQKPGGFPLPASGLKYTVYAFQGTALDAGFVGNTPCGLDLAFNAMPRRNRIVLAFSDLSATSTTLHGLSGGNSFVIGLQATCASGSDCWAGDEDLLVAYSTVVAHPAPAPSPSPSPAGPTHHKLTGGQVAGIVIGVLLGLALIAVGVWWFVFRDRNAAPRFDYTSSGYAAMMDD